MTSGSQILLLTPNFSFIGKNTLFNLIINLVLIVFLLHITLMCLNLNLDTEAFWYPNSVSVSKQFRYLDFSVFLTKIIWHELQMVFWGVLERHWHFSQVFWPSKICGRHTLPAVTFCHTFFYLLPWLQLHSSYDINSFPLVHPFHLFFWLLIRKFL